MRFAIRASRILPFAGEKAAQGTAAINTPSHVLKDFVITSNAGIIESVESYQNFRKKNGRPELFDLGDVTVVPGLINAHCHLELSYLSGKQLKGKGFSRWLKRLVQLINEPEEEKNILNGITFAVNELVDSGTVHVGDIGSRYPHEIARILKEISSEINSTPPFPCNYPLSATHFLEVLGFKPTSTSMPVQLNAKEYTPDVAAKMPEWAYPDCAIAGHALYSTSPEGLAAAHDWCGANNKTFSLHLAESEEETTMLLDGTGELYDFFSHKILPENWFPPKARPVPYAQTLGLLDKKTLAVHCVQCNDHDIDILANSKTSVCLCPRSNEFINVGLAQANKMAEAGILLCLGTDGLSSNDSLNIGEEMKAAQKNWGFGTEAVLRMTTINAAHALGIEKVLGSIEPGKKAAFAILEDLM